MADKRAGGPLVGPGRRGRALGVRGLWRRTTRLPDRRRRTERGDLLGPSQPAFRQPNQPPIPGFFALRRLVLDVAARRHGRRVSTAKVDRRFFSCELGYLFERPPQQRPARFGAVGVGCHKVNESLFEHPFRHVLAGGTKGPHQAAGGDLHQATLIDEGRNLLGLLQQALVPFRVGEDSGEIRRAQPCEDSLQRKVQLMGQFQQHVLAPIGQGHHVAGPQACEQRFVNPHIGPRKHAQGNPVVVQVLLQLPRALPNDVAFVVGVSSQLVRRHDDRFDSVVGRHLSHGEGFLPGLGPIVDAWDQVAVDVNERLRIVHGFLPRFARPTCVFDKSTAHAGTDLSGRDFPSGAEYIGFASLVNTDSAAIRAEGLRPADRIYPPVAEEWASGGR